MAYLLRRLVTEAARRGARPAVITFDAHPDEILTGTAPPLLVDPDERLARIARAGVAVTVVQHFDRRLRETPFDGFVRMITDRTELAGFLMTPDAAFGYQRGGTPETPPYLLVLSTGEVVATSVAPEVQPPLGDLRPYQCAG